MPLVRVSNGGTPELTYLGDIPIGSSDNQQHSYSLAAYASYKTIVIFLELTYTNSMTSNFANCTATWVKRVASNKTVRGIAVVTDIKSNSTFTCENGGSRISYVCSME